MMFAIGSFLFTYTFYCRFVIFSNEKKLLIYKDFSNETVNNTQINLLDSLDGDTYKELSDDIKSTSYVTSVSINKLNDKNNVFNDQLKKDLSDLDGFQYLVSVSLDNSLLLLYLYNCRNNSFKILTYNKSLCGNNKDGQLFDDISQLDTVFDEDVYTLFMSNHNLCLLNWKTVKSTKLLSDVSTYKLFNKQLFVFFNDSLKVYNFNPRFFNSTDSNMDSVLDLKHDLPFDKSNGLLNSKNSINKKVVTFLEDKKLLFLADYDGIFYTFLDKFNFYKFVSSLNSPETPTSSQLTNGTDNNGVESYYSYLSSIFLSDMTVLLSINRDHLQVWDYDTQNILYQMDNSKQYIPYSLTYTLIKLFRRI